MFTKNKVTIIKEVDTDNIPNISRALLVHINGNSSLKTTYYKDPSDDYDILSDVIISLNDEPLIYSKRSSCPTCASLIATGHGLNNNSSILEDISDTINEDFVSLEKSIKDITLLLELLEPGLYIIADNKHYPTNGMNKFFWDTSDEFETNKASAPAYLPYYELDQWYFAGSPTYLYPTQHSRFYNSERVEYYKERFKTKNNKPRAIVYYFEEFLSFILDGHHKACAATLLNEPVNTLTIIPSTGRMTHFPNTSEETHYYTFGSIKILEKDVPRRFRESFTFPKKKDNPEVKSHRLNEKIWEEEYKKNVLKYPSLEIFSLSQGYDFEDFSDEFIYSLFELPTETLGLKMDVILARMIATKDHRLKDYASYCLLHAQNTSTKERAIKSLLMFENDEQVEQTLIEYLVIDQDPHSYLRKLISSYWE